MRGKSRRLPWLLLWPWSLFTTVILYPSLCSSLFLSSGWIAKWRLTSSDPCLVKLLARLNRKATNEKIHIVHLDPGVRSRKILSVSYCTYFGKLLCHGCMPLMALIPYWQQHAAIIHHMQLHSAGNFGTMARAVPYLVTVFTHTEDLNSWVAQAASSKVPCHKSWEF